MGDIDGAVQDRSLSRPQAGFWPPNADIWHPRERRFARAQDGLNNRDPYERAVATNFKFGMHNYQDAMKEAAETGRPVVFVYSDRANTHPDPRAGLIGKTKQLYGGSAQADSQAIYVYADLNQVRQNPNAGPARWLAEQALHGPSILVFNVDKNGKKTDGLLFEHIPRDANVLKGAIDEIKAAHLPLTVPKEALPPPPPVPQLRLPPGASDRPQLTPPPERTPEARPPAPESTSPPSADVGPPTTAVSENNSGAAGALRAKPELPSAIVADLDRRRALEEELSKYGAVDQASKLLAGNEADGTMSYRTTHAQLEKFMGEYEKYLATHGEKGQEPFNSARAVKLYAKLKHLYKQEHDRLDEVDQALSGSDLSSAAALKEKTKELRKIDDAEWRAHKPEEKLKEALLAAQLHILQPEAPEGKAPVIDQNEGAERAKTWQTFKKNEEARLAQVGSFDSTEYNEVVRQFEAKYPRLSYASFSQALAQNNTYERGNQLVQERDKNIREIEQSAIQGDKAAVQFLGKVLADNGQPLANDGSVVHLGRDAGYYHTNARRWTDSAAITLTEASKPERSGADNRAAVASVLSAAMVDPRVNGEARMRLMAGLQDLTLPPEPGKAAPLSPSQECLILMNAITADTKCGTPSSHFQEQAIARLAALNPESLGATEIDSFLRQLRDHGNANVARVAQDAVLKLEPDLPTILARTAANPLLTPSERAQGVKAKLSDPSQPGVYETIVKYYKGYEVNAEDKENYDQLKSLVENEAIDPRLRLFASERFLHSCLGTDDPGYRSATNFVGEIAFTKDQVPPDIKRDSVQLLREATAAGQVVVRTKKGTFLITEQGDIP
jgi:hypothetical protein